MINSKHGKDITGMKFGSLTALYQERINEKNGAVMWMCKCDCGNYTQVETHLLIKGNTKSCGCSYKKERPHRRKEGTGTRLYRVWSNMKSRCTNPNASSFKWYGGRGISFCDEWASFGPFREWANEHGYDDSLELDRINTDGNYSPENCRFISHQENCMNRRKTTCQKLTTSHS